MYALLVEDVDGLVDRASVREELDRGLQGMPAVLQEPDRETWGLLPEDIAAMHAAMGRD